MKARSKARAKSWKVEVWVKVKDPNVIAVLMVAQGVSHRQLASAVGWNSHSMVRRILSGDLRTVTPDRAAAMAKFFGVGIEHLFVTRVSSDTGLSVQFQKTNVKQLPAAKRGVAA